MKKEKYDIGNIFKNNQNCEYKIIEKIGYNKRKIQFLDEYGYEKVVGLCNIESGNIRNLYFKSVYGVGYFGEGIYKAKIQGKIQRAYDVWVRIIDRCYNEESNHKNKSYRNITLHKEWFNYQNFAEWYEKNYPKIKDIRFELDKDLLQKFDINKIYSPETCIFLPQKVNIFLANKKSNNTSGCPGVSFIEKTNKWRVYTNYFGENKQKWLGCYTNIEDAILAYKNGRKYEANKAKEYLRSLDYLKEDIIELIE